MPELTGKRGVDVAFEVIGMAATIYQTIAMTRRGGHAVLVGIPGMDAMVELPAFLGLVLAAKTVTGCCTSGAGDAGDIHNLR